MVDNGIPPTGPHVQGPNGPGEPNSQQNVATGPFAKLFPGASPEIVKKFTMSFINYSIQQMKQDQQNMLDAIKKMQEDQDQN